MAVPSALEIARLAEAQRSNSPLAQLGQLVQGGMQAYQQGAAQKEQKEARTQAKSSRAQAANLIKQAVENPEQSEALFVQAYQADPEFVTGFMNVQKTKSSNAGQGTTRYQAVPFKTGFRIFDKKEGEFTGDLIEDKAAADAQVVELRAKESKANPLASATEGQKKAATFSRRMFDSADQLEQLESIIDPTNRLIPIISGGSGVLSEVSNRAASPEEQQYASAASDFVTAQLRKESGAAIGKDEFDRKYREYFPMPGDSKAQIEAKRKRRRKAANDMSVESGGLYESLYGSKEEVIDNGNGGTEEVEESTEIIEWGSLGGGK